MGRSLGPFRCESAVAAGGARACQGQRRRESTPRLYRLVAHRRSSSWNDLQRLAWRGSLVQVQYCPPSDSPRNRRAGRPSEFSFLGAGGSDAARPAGGFRTCASGPPRSRPRREPGRRVPGRFHGALWEPRCPLQPVGRERRLRTSPPTPVQPSHCAARASSELVPASS
jgi:hypothetical protein